MDVFDEIKNKLLFERVLEEEFKISQRYNVYLCPFCNKYSFSIYGNTVGYCHNKDKPCKWNDFPKDCLQLYMDLRGITDVGGGIISIAEKYDLNLKSDIINYSTEIRQAKNERLFVDLIIIDEFKILMCLLDKKQKDIEKEFNVSRKSLYLVLKKQFDDENIGKQKWYFIVNLMFKYIQKNKDYLLMNSLIRLSPETNERIKKMNEFIEKFYIT